MSYTERKYRRPVRLNSALFHILPLAFAARVGVVLLYADFNNNLIENAPLRDGLLLLRQVLLSTGAIRLLYCLARRFFDECAGLLAAAIAAALPEFLYTCLAFAPTVLCHFLIGLFFRALTELNEEKGKTWVIGLLAAALIYLRSKFVLIFAAVVGDIARRENIAGRSLSAG